MALPLIPHLTRGKLAGLPNAKNGNKMSISIWESWCFSVTWRFPPSLPCNDTKGEDTWLLKQTCRWIFGKCLIHCVILKGVGNIGPESVSWSYHVGGGVDMEMMMDITGSPMVPFVLKPHFIQRIYIFIYIYLYIFISTHTHPHTHTHTHTRSLIGFLCSSKNSWQPVSKAKNGLYAADNVHYGWSLKGRHLCLSDKWNQFLPGTGIISHWRRRRSRRPSASFL